MESPSITELLARWCHGLAWEDLPAAQQDKVLNSLVDTVGVAIAGTREADFAPVLGFAAATHANAGGHAEAWGLGGSSNASHAAFLNAVAGHIMDFDDVHYLIHGHASTVLFPALMAVAQEEDLRMERVLTGYVAGVGVMAAVSRLYGPRHYSHGWHSTSTCGAVGAAAAIATALSLDLAPTITAMSAAVSMSMGVRANFGTLMKPIHAGLAARAGVEAVLLARLGATSAEDALAAPLGGVDVFGDGSWPAGYADPAATVLDTARNGLDELGLKLYPCCRGGHYAIDAALEARDQIAAPESITGVRVTVPLGTKTALIHDDPQTGLEAKFSLPYAVATSLAHGLPEPRHFTDAAVQDPATRRMMDLIEVEEETSNGDLSASMEGRYASVTVETADGGRAASTVNDARGSWSRPLARQEIDRKFLVTAGTVLEPDRAAALLATLRGPSGTAAVRGLFNVPLLLTESSPARR